MNTKNLVLVTLIVMLMSSACTGTTTPAPVAPVVATAQAEATDILATQSAAAAAEANNAKATEIVAAALGISTPTPTATRSAETAATATATEAPKATEAPATVTPAPTATIAASNTPATAPAQAIAQPTQVTADFPLKGLRFPAYASGSLNVFYDLFVEANGRFWQKWLPVGPERIAHSVAFELPEGSYTFNGVICRLYVDVARNGNGSKNPITVAEGNDLRFSVKLPAGASYQTAWALTECSGGSPSGFDIWYLGK